MRKWKKKSLQRFDISFSIDQLKMTDNCDINVGLTLFKICRKLIKNY